MTLFPSESSSDSTPSSELSPQTEIAGNNPPSVSEIQDRLRRRYLDRLAQKVKRMRKLLLERDWQGLRNETRQLKGSGESFGFSELTDLAKSAESSIPAGAISRVKPLPEAKQTVEDLIGAIDRILADHSTRFI